MLCSTWRGVIVTRDNGQTVSTDTVLAFTINRDGTWSLKNQLGVFTGQWSFRDEKPGFYFALHCDTPKPEFNKYFVGYFRDGGLDLHSTHEVPHTIDVKWKLKR